MHNTDKGMGTHNSESDGESGPEEPDTSLESIYTRCCHLREILPITATLKQIKGRTPPLAVIRIMNPRPTLIEVLSFSDFLSVAPIKMVILDNVSLSNEMFRYILTALVRSKPLSKLSLRNVIMDATGWKMLCAFLLENKTLLKLDITMQKAKGDTQMNRAHLDWSLLTKALVARGGIEELLVNGCMVPSDQLPSFILNGCRSTKRLGLAMNDLHKEEMDILLNWVQSPSCVCEGLDLGGNDLSSVWEELFKIISARSLMFLSINATNLSRLDRATQLLQILSEQASLRFIDLSNNPGLFPAFTPALAQMLPKFEDLRRIHLDSNDLSSDDIVRLSRSFYRCPNLVHVSMLDNSKIDSTACAALTAATHLSNSLYTIESDSKAWPPGLQKMMLSYCLANMEIQAGRISPDEKEAGEYKISETEELMEAGNAFARAAEEMLLVGDDEGTSKKLVETITRRAHNLREQVHDSLEELFRKREQTPLSTDEKEEIVKLCFLDGNLESVLNQYASQTGPANTHMSEHLLSLGPRTRNQRSNPPAGAPDLEIAAMNEAEPTGQLSRASSSTSLHLKEQELEEGQFHKLGTYIERRRNSEGSKDNVAPGEEIREAVLKAKGDRNVSGLIGRLEQLHGSDLVQAMEKLGLKTETDQTSEGSSGESTGGDANVKLDEQKLDRVIDDIARALP
jgi:hypothetical protein